MQRSHAANPGRHRLADRGDDLYETPPAAVEALLRVEQLPRRVWEPCCGPGSVVKVLRAAGHDVVATDLNDWKCPQSEHGVDFLAQRQAPDGVTAVVTNPPYKLADAFVAHALELVPKLCVLLRLAFLESARRTPILESGRLARIHVFRNRLPMMHRFGWTGRRTSSSIAFAWFVFDGKCGGPTVVDRITACTERTAR